MGRYSNRIVFNNDHELYKSILLEKQKIYIRQYATSKFNYPTAAQIASMKTVGHIWTIGDSFWKLASKYYGNPTKGYIIGWFNKKPTEHHISIGDVISIPLDLNEAEALMGI